MTLALLALALLLAACTLRTATDGPVTVILGPADRITDICRYWGGARTAQGCLVWQGTRLSLYCGYNDVGCLSHEIRHAVDPAWRHD